MRPNRPGMLRTIAVHYPISGLFVIVPVTRRFLVLFRGLYLLELKIKDFSGLAVSQTIQGAGKLFCQIN